MHDHEFDCEVLAVVPMQYCDQHIMLCSFFYRALTRLQCLRGDDLVIFSYKDNVDRISEALLKHNCTSGGKRVIEHFLFYKLMNSVTYPSVLNSPNGSFHITNMSASDDKEKRRNATDHWIRAYVIESSSASFWEELEKVKEESCPTFSDARLMQGKRREYVNQIVKGNAYASHTLVVGAARSRKKMYELLHDLLREGMSPNITDEHGASPLTVACNTMCFSQSTIKILKLILEGGGVRTLESAYGQVMDVINSGCISRERLNEHEDIAAFLAGFISNLPEMNLMNQAREKLRHSLIFSDCGMTFSEKVDRLSLPTVIKGYIHHYL